MPPQKLEQNKPYLIPTFCVYDDESRLKYAGHTQVELNLGIIWLQTEPPAYDLGEHEIIVCMYSYPESYYVVDRRAILADVEVPDPFKQHDECRQFMQHDFPRTGEAAIRERLQYRGRSIMNEADLLKYTQVAKSWFGLDDPKAWARCRLNPDWYTAGFLEEMKKLAVA